MLVSVAVLLIWDRDFKIVELGNVIKKREFKKGCSILQRIVWKKVKSRGNWTIARCFKQREVLSLADEGRDESFNEHHTNWKEFSVRVKSGTEGAAIKSRWAYQETWKDYKRTDWAEQGNRSAGIKSWKWKTEIREGMRS